MTAGPETEAPEPDQSIPTDDASVSPATDTALDIPLADVPLRRPTLDGRQVRARVLWEVRTKLVVDGQVTTWLYRREPAARAHAARLRAQGWPVRVAVATVTGWSMVG